MQPGKIAIKGIIIEEFLPFVEDRKMEAEGPYTSITIEEAERNYGDGKRAGIGEVVLLVLTIAQDLLKDLFKDFLKDRLKKGVHSVKYKLINEKGESIEITLNELTLKEVEVIINNFQGNISQITSEEIPEK